MRHGLLIGSLLVLVLPALAGAATLRVVEQEFDFAEDSVLDVQVVVEDAADVAGLEFSLVYPGDLLAVEAPTTHTAGGFLAAPVVNHDADASGLPAGARRIAVALAGAEASGVATGTVLTVSFPLRCSDYSGDWPDGRLVDIAISDAAAWGIGAGGLPEPVALTPVDGSFLVDCTTVALGDTGLSTLKARYGREQ